MDALQVSLPDADIQPMDRDYQQMGSAERQRHHDELVDEGYEWCPECGSTLVWDLPEAPAEERTSSYVPVVTGDCPPLTAEQLLATIPIS